ncbi:MAG: hypothetical protein CL920_11345 [Deltaproteobacteria bacterium]|mgnify:CR=1 FL=1|nr:hypothetical protein [Deltaproteobacteria bacterium]
MRVRLFSIAFLFFGYTLLNLYACSEGKQICQKCTSNLDCVECGGVCFQGQCQINSKPDGGTSTVCTVGETRECYNGAPETKGVGTCRAGTQTCLAGGTWGQCTGEVTPVIESYDKKDNDCDGQVDEGIRICQPVGEEIPCYPKDVTVGCTLTDAKTNKWTCVGACTTGKALCTGQPGVCKLPVTPKVEICNNNIDEDCDGEVDNKSKLGQPCEDKDLPDKCQKGIYACDAKTNEMYCKPNGAIEEVCDGKDNDCDGKVDNVRGKDEALTKDCSYSGPKGTKDVGECKSSSQKCVNGQWDGQCGTEILPKTEECNGKDDDCDGKVDNRPGTPQPLTKSCYEGPPGTRNVGECKDGKQACINGKWDTTCAGATLPTDEKFCQGATDSKDFDCDGIPNNSTLLDKPCISQVNKGLCRYGKYICYQGQIACQPQLAPNSNKEECNGKDDDCDGFIDNGAAGSATQMTKSCYTGNVSTHNRGICTPGSAVCDKGRWSECQGEVTPRPELCNGQDDNCNGQADEGTTCGPCSPGQQKQCWISPANPVNPLVGTCQPGVETCTAAGRWSGICQGAQSPQPEQCNGQDDDCDGQVDNLKGTAAPMSQECYTGDKANLGKGECRGGIQLCIQGKWSQTCFAEQKPELEICDKLDNDCDGSIDENGICSTNKPRAVKELCTDAAGAPSYKKCNTGLYCLQAAETSADQFCYQSCSTSADCSKNTTDGRTECQDLGTDEKTGQRVKICIRRAGDSAYCDFARGFFCSGGLFCDEGLKICRRPTQAGLYAPCEGSTGAICDSGYYCDKAFIHSSKDHGYCLRTCQTSAECQGAPCVSPPSGGPKICVPVGQKTEDQTCSHLYTGNGPYDPKDMCQAQHICLRQNPSNPNGVCLKAIQTATCTAKTCPTGRACAPSNGVVVCPKACKQDTDCATDQTCLTIQPGPPPIQFCMAKTPTGQQNFGDICGKGQYCQPGMTCFQTNPNKAGVCTYLGCTTDADCVYVPTGSKCKSAGTAKACLFPCTSNNDCPNANLKCDPIYNFCIP